ncbi:MAG: tRNA (adenosine(37)-N6)-threonylcarbamoyltransferase complex dimerization subunit type 1 TsaB [Lachnospiraceae bacterium]|nr:tRNA (adenosine(37)-N6)-threonylcarbamoyltransferase complex dimerization subunit type 1 TsaB [Lachnospiraceae bacterium]
MKILAVDSSGLVASVALIEDGILIAEYTLNYKKTHSVTLVPMLDEIRSMTELDLNTIDAIATAKGPGSFTGLRIGSATVKGLGLALDKPIIAIPTVDALSMNAFGYRGLVCPMMDARREQVYTGIYRFKEAGKREPLILLEQCAISIYELASKLEEKAKSLAKEGELPILFLGDGVPVYKESLDRLMKDKGLIYEYAPCHMGRQRAAALAALAESYYERGIMETASEHSPEYLRVSQAERERMEKNDNT